MTFDSNFEPWHSLVLAAKDAGWDIAFASVSSREAKGTSLEISLGDHEAVSELGVWEESFWDQARWADDTSSKRLANILKIIFNASFPNRMSDLTEGQSRQLRDAMILEAHCAAQRDIFVTLDGKAFINHERREKLEALFKTRVLNRAEFETELKARMRDA